VVAEPAVECCGAGERVRGVVLDRVLGPAETVEGVERRGRGDAGLCEGVMQGFMMVYGIS
jgi:hypothetical protein